MKFFEDKHGRTVVWQWPNLPIYGWLGFKLLALVLPAGHLRHGSELLSMAFLFTWAYLELTSGVNYFRKLLGLIVLVAIVYGFFAR